MKKRLVAAATGASGMPLFLQCLELIREAEEFESWVMVSHGAWLTLRQETDQGEERLRELADHLLPVTDISQGPASGSFQTAGMLIAPCSMKTAAGIRCGYSDNLILRAADVTIKEQRPLVLAPREAPLSPIHLENLLALSRLPGVRIVPPMMTFYHKPQTIEEMVYHLAAKLVEPFGIAAKEYRRWNGM